MFDVHRVAQMAGYFLYRGGNSPMNHVKLMKLMYLSDRQALATYRLPISDDTYCCMMHGPVLERTLSLFEGKAEPTDQALWSSWASEEAGNMIQPNRKLNDNDFDRLASAEMDALAVVHDSFGTWDWQKLVDYTHRLKEWDPPDESGGKEARKPLSLKRILMSLEDASTEKKPLMTEKEADLAVHYLREVVPNMKLRLSIEEFNSSKQIDPKVRVDALKSLLNV